MAATQIEGHEAAGSVIVPPRCIRILGSILGSDGDVLVSVEANHITFQYQGITIFSRLIEGRFPRWEKIVPPEEEMPCSFAIMAGALRTGYQQAGIVATERQPGVEMTATTGLLKFGGAGAEIGESSIEIPVSYDGADVTVKLDPKFVIEFAKSLPADKLVTVRLDAAGERPALFATDDSCRYVVMPLT